MRSLARRYQPRRLDLLLEAGQDLPASLDKPLGPGVNAWLCQGVNCLPPIDALARLTEVLDAGG
jgi:hypothetical protein